MSEEDFLSRWSRRKREASEDAARGEAARPREAHAVQPRPAGNKEEPEIELSSLPPIESITAATDITAFLRKGIPLELTRAALRRAWTSDPFIRDFVGLAENAWDFNDSTAMPGFGPLDCSEAELSAWVERIVGGLRETVESLPDAPMKPQDLKDFTEVSSQIEASVAVRVREQSATIERTPLPAASQPSMHEKAESGGDAIPRRTHGGALPR
jgi:hypothetical protein